MADHDRIVRVALLADGQGGLNGVAEVYRNTIAALPEGIEVIPIGCRGGRGDPPIAVPAIGAERIRFVPEVDCLVPSPRRLREAIRSLDADLIHVTGPGPLGIAGISAAGALDLPVLAAFHTDLGSYARHWLGMTKRPRLVEIGLARFYRRAQAWLAPGEWARRRLAGLISTDPRRIGVLAQGVDSRRFAPARYRVAGKDDSATILTVSRLSAEKSLETLIDAMALISRPHSRLMIIGRGPIAAPLRRRAQRLRVDLQLPGPLDGDRLSDAYRSATLFCLPSQTETCGQVLLEAQASGLACVVSPSGGAAETIGQGSAGAVAGGDTPAEFALAVRRLLKDPHQRETLARRGRTNALARPWERTARDLASHYRSMSGSSARSRTKRHAPAESPSHLTP